jgi:hypothetical protein
VLLPAEKKSSSFSKRRAYSGDIKTFDFTDVRLGTLRAKHLQTRSQEIKYLYLETHNLNAGSQRVQLCFKSVLPEHEQQFPWMLDFRIFCSLTRLQILDFTNNKFKSLHDERLFK